MPNTTQYTHRMGTVLAVAEGIYDAIVGALYLCDHQEAGAGSKARVIIAELVKAGWLPEDTPR